MSHKQNLKPVHLHKLQICVCGCPCKPLPKLTWRWWTVWQVHLSAPAHAISCRTYSSKKGCKHVQHLHSTKCVNTYSYSWILHVDLTWNGKLIFFYIFEKDTGMCLLQQCHLARTSPEELGVFRNVDMATGSSLTRAPLLVSSTAENRFGTGLP